MTLLFKHNGKQLKGLAERKRQEGASDEEMLALFGREPYYWDLRVAPVYSRFAAQWRDDTGREYMEIDDSRLAVRLPISKNKSRTMLMPVQNEKLRLVEVGGGDVLSVEVISVNMAQGRSATGWIEYKNS